MRKEQNREEGLYREERGIKRDREIEKERKKERKKERVNGIEGKNIHLQYSSLGRIDFVMLKVVFCMLESKQFSVFQSLSQLDQGRVV